MNCTGLHTDFHATLEQSKQATARIARIASESQAECERMSKRIKALESALHTAVVLLENPDATAFDADARLAEFIALLSKGK